MRDDRNHMSDAAEELQVAIRDSIERARELVCEARLVMRQQEAQEAEPPNSAH